MILPTFCIAAIATIALTAVIRGYILEGQRDKARNEAVDNDRDEARIALRIAVEREKWREMSRRMPGHFNWNVTGGDG